MIQQHAPFAQGAGKGAARLWRATRLASTSLGLSVRNQWTVNPECGWHASLFGTRHISSTAYLNSRFSAASFSPGSLDVRAMGMTEMPRARSSVRYSSEALSALFRYPWPPASSTGRTLPLNVARGTTLSWSSSTWAGIASCGLFNNFQGPDKALHGWLHAAFLKAAYKEWQCLTQWQ